MGLPDLSQLPLVLAGPILRRVDKTQIAVWVALKSAATIRLVLHFDGRKIAATEQNDTVAIGSHLHVALVTFNLKDNPPLVAGTLYAYDLRFVVEGGASQGLMDPGVLTSAAYPGNPQSLIAYEQELSRPEFSGLPVLPTFVYPANHPRELVIAQGSCRKPHADSIDSLLLLDEQIRTQFGPTQRRPQQLFLTGDQIYADDVADALLAVLGEVATTLVGPEMTAELQGLDIKPGQRAATMRDQAGFTVDVTEEGNKAKSHLITFGEYCAMYLCAWSDVLWRREDALPEFEKVYPGVPKYYSHEPYNDPDAKRWETVKFRAFKKEVAGLESFRASLPRVRRALANIPVYMIFDDHEVTDDWLINREWLFRVTAKPLGMRVVGNGLSAFAIFQAWGNAPAEVDGERGVVALISEWAQSGFLDEAMREEIYAQLGMPHLTGKPNEFPRDREVPRVLDWKERVQWAFRIGWTCHQVIALDTRTRRIYPEGRLDAPGVVSSEGLEFVTGAHAAAPTDEFVTLVIAPAPVVGLSFIEEKQRGYQGRESAFEKDVEAPKLEARAFDDIVSRVAEVVANPSARFVFLSGDVHYSMSSRLRYWGTKVPESTKFARRHGVFAQFTASALKNQSSTYFIGTLTLHLAGFRGSKKTIARLGWNVDPNAETVDVGRLLPRPTTSNPAPNPVTWELDATRAVSVSELDQERKGHVAVEPQLVPDRIMQMELLAAGPRVIDVPRFETRPTSSAERFVAVMILVANLVFGYWLTGLGGKKVVGVNNLGLLSFVWEGAQKTAIQELRWWSQPAPTMYWAQRNGTELTHVKTTRVEVALEYAEPPDVTRIEV